jgi:predicted nuclease of predicted toxin-antitoxin system
VKLLVDNALPPRLAGLLSADGFDAVHVRAYGMGAAPDSEILIRAREEDRVIVSADTDFGTLLATQESAKPSFVLIRDSELVTAEDFFGVLRSSLRLLEAELSLGCVVVIRSGRMRIRRLPISR